MLGGFVLAAFCVSAVVAWPGRRRWPWWLIAGLALSITLTLALSLQPAGGPLPLLWIPSAAVSLAFIGLAGVHDLRRPSQD